MATRSQRFMRHPKKRHHLSHDLLPISFGRIGVEHKIHDCQVGRFSEWKCIAWVRAIGVLESDIRETEAFCPDSAHAERFGTQVDNGESDIRVLRRGLK